jgi:cytoskeletal protein RodZ
MSLARLPPGGFRRLAALAAVLPRSQTKDRELNMQRWKCAVGAVVLLAVAGGSIVGCGKSGDKKQNAAQAKAKPKGDPKSAKADAKTAKTDPKAAKADPKAAKPAQTAAKTTPAAPAPAPAQKETAANTKPAAPAQAAATKPAAPAQKPAQAAANAKPATPPAAPAQTTAAAKTPAAPVEQTTASSELQQSLTNKTLIAQLQSRLPAGTDVLKASMGFRNLTQFVSAVHASQNLSIPFDKMRTAMVDEKKSLSNAIRALKPTATATIEAQRADYDARGTIYQAQHPDTPATDAPAKKAKPSTK